MGDTTHLNQVRNGHLLENDKATNPLSVTTENHINTVDTVTAAVLTS